MNLKIGLTGAQGTGKTTLSKALARELGLPLIEEQARIAIKEFGMEKPGELRKNPRLAVRFQNLCLQKQIAAEKELSGGFVSDRTVIDSAVYWMKWHSCKAGSRKNMLVYNQIQNHLDSLGYNLILYTPIEFGLENDCFRSTNPHYQREMDFLARCFLQMVTPGTCKVVTVSGPVEERLRTAVHLAKVISN